MKNLTPTKAIALMTHLTSGVRWAELDLNDRAAFEGAGDDARIAQLGTLRSELILDIIDDERTFADDVSLMALIGGDADGLQIELHGVDADGDPVAYTLPITIHHN